MTAGASRAAILLALGALALSLPAAAQGSAPPPSAWESRLHRDHALAGTIWSVRAKRAVFREDLVAALAASPIVLLGEVHDNPDHHRLRASLIETLASRRQPTQPAGTGRFGPALVFEHIRADQQPVVDAVLASPGKDAASDATRLLRELAWERSGWPSGASFSPLFEAALRFRLPILGGNAPNASVRTVGRRGLSALPGEERARLELDVQLEAPLDRALISEIGASHCGLLPASAFGPMALAQQYRDAHLADVVLSGQSRYGSSVLIAGNGHVRADRGVPWHLRRRAAGLGTVVVAFAEVDGGRMDAGSYVPRDPAGQPAADYVWFTPGAERPDPCEAMRRDFEGMRRSSPRPPAGR